jgi:DNA-binding NarL/FixJ family response regulator
MNGDSDDVITLRSKPQLIVLDRLLNIVYGDWTAMQTLLGASEDRQEQLRRLPPPVETAVRQVLDGWRDGSPAEEAVVPILPEVVLRVSRLTGDDSHYVALFFETRARRDDVAHAAERYALTKREVEVLALLLRGATPAEIAEHLTIAETTVGDYTKQLLRKTGAKNRADMVARVLGWSSRERRSRDAQEG